MKQSTPPVVAADQSDMPAHNPLHLSASLDRATAKRILELGALSVTNIRINIVPGEEGNGEEVYATSVADVEQLIGKLGAKAEDFDLETQPLRSKVAALEAQLEATADQLEATETCGKLMDAWIHEHGSKIPWSKAVELIATVLKYSEKERDRVLCLDTPDIQEQRDTALKRSAALREFKVDQWWFTVVESVAAVRNLLNRIHDTGEPNECASAPMTLDEAIVHAEALTDSTPCGQQHGQLATWLREYRQLRKVQH